MLTSTERFVDTNGVRLRVTEAGERGAPVVLLAHGWPELAFSWRRQIPALVEAGYHVLAPDQRGYGGSDRPDAVTDYDIAELCRDLVGLLDDVGAERAVIVGHDWGSTVAWSSLLLHPERFAGVVGMSVPPVPRSKVPPTHALRKIFRDSFFYQLYFQEPGIADAELDRDPATALRRLMAPAADGAAPRVPVPSPEGFIERMPEPGGLPDWISPDEFDHYVAEFTRTGFTGGLNWYRNLDRNWELMANAPATAITAPALFIGGTADAVLSFMRPERAREVVAGPYREVMIEGAGHWIQQERADEVNPALLDFLSEVEL